jgi:transposase-like protein
MRYAQGGGLTAEGRRRREQLRLEAVQRFERRVPTADIAAALRVTERSVRRWRRAWQAGGPAGVASRGQAARCLLDERQLAALDAALEAGPLASGWGGSAVDAGPRPGPGRGEVQGAVHDPGDLVPAAPPRLDLPAGCAPGHRARRRRGRGVEEGDLAADKSTAAALGGWIVFEDECGQSLRPPRARTWGRRGITPVIRVRGGGTGHVSIAGLEGIWSVLKRGVLANLAVASFGHLVQVIRHGLKKIQYQPGLIEGCLAGTGLALEPAETPTDIKN